jgi:hypothetical protein
MTKPKPTRRRRKRRSIKAVAGEALDERNFIDWQTVVVTFENGKAIFHGGKRSEKNAKNKEARVHVRRLPQNGDDRSCRNRLLR